MPHEPLDVEGSATWRTWFLAASPSFRLSRSTKDMSSTLTKTFRCLEKMLVADSGKKYPSTLTTGNFVKVSDAGWPLSMNHATILMQNCTAITPGIDPFWKSSSKPLGLETPGSVGPGAFNQGISKPPGECLLRVRPLVSLHQCWCGSRLRCQGLKEKKHQNLLFHGSVVFLCIFMFLFEKLSILNIF